MCSLDGAVYVLGGQTRYCTNGKRTTNEAHRFDASTCRWTKLSPMREARSLFYAGAIGRKIYAVSGWVKPQSVTRTVEVYDPATDRWRYVYRLDRGVHEHAGCVVGGKLYISGGYKGPMNGHLDDLKAFDPDTTHHDMGEWTSLAPMQVRFLNFQSLVYHRVRAGWQGNTTYKGSLLPFCFELKKLTKDWVWGLQLVTIMLQWLE